MVTLTPTISPAGSPGDISYPATQTQMASLQKLENGVLTLHVFKAVIPDIPDKEIRVQSAPAEATTAPSVPADNVVHGPSDGDAASSHIDKEQKDPAITA